MTLSPQVTERDTASLPSLICSLLQGHLPHLRMVRPSHSASVDSESLCLSPISLPRLDPFSLLPSYSEGCGARREHPSARRTSRQGGTAGPGPGLSSTALHLAWPRALNWSRTLRGSRWVEMKGPSWAGPGTCDSLTPDLAQTPWPSSRPGFLKNQIFFSLGTKADPLCSRQKGARGRGPAPQESQEPTSRLLISWVRGK